MALFNISSQPIQNNAHEIATDYEVLLFDEEDVLFTGRNKQGFRVIANIICEDEYEYTIRYLKLFINDITYGLIKDGTLFYRQFIDSCTFCFIVDKYPSGIISVYKILVADIPKDFLPLYSFDISKLIV